MRRAVAIAMAVATPGSACSSGVGAPPQPPVDWGGLRAADAVRASTREPGERKPEKRELAEVYASAVASAGFVKLAPLVDEDAHFSFPGQDDARGRGPVIHAHAVLFGAFDDRHFVTTRILRAADEETAEWTMTGTQSRDWMGVAPTQRAVAFRGVTLLWRKDGTISNIHVCFDVAAVKAQLGAAPHGFPPAGAVPSPQPPSSAPRIVDRNGQEDDNVATVRNALDAIEDDERLYLGVLADDVEIYTLERATPLRGKRAAGAYFRALHAAIGQVETTIDAAWGISDYAVVKYTVDGLDLGAIGWVPARKDAVLRFHVVDVNEVRNGKIQRIWRYDNPAEALIPGP